MPRHAKKWWQGMIRAGTKAWSGLVPRHDLYFCHGLNRTSAKSTFFKACSLFRTCAWAWWGQKWQKHDQDWCQGIIRIYCSAYCLGRHAHWSTACCQDLLCSMIRPNTNSWLSFGCSGAWWCRMAGQCREPPWPAWRWTPRFPLLHIHTLLHCCIIYLLK